jgi:energy-coupling factor transport system substrate-specific component
MRTWRQWLELVVISLISAAACAVIISWGVDLLGLVPFKVLSTIITTNDTIGHIVGGILLLLIWDRVKAIGLYWREVMAPEDIARPIAPTIGALLLVIGGVVGWIVGAFLLPPAMAVPVGAIFVVATLVPLLLL